jgi:DNA-binding CsgD family transcriptional regulator
MGSLIEDSGDMLGRMQQLTAFWRIPEAHEEEVAAAVAAANEYRAATKPGVGFRLSAYEEVAIWFLHGRGMRRTAISERLGISRNTVSQRLLPGRREDNRRRSSEWRWDRRAK